MLAGLRLPVMDGFVPEGQVLPTDTQFNLRAFSGFEHHLFEAFQLFNWTRNAALWSLYVKLRNFRANHLAVVGNCKAHLERIAP